MENGLFKKAVQPCPEPVEGKAAAYGASGAYKRVRGNGTEATCLRVAASAKAGNPASRFFNIPHF
jgi:hypothetical protein